MQLHWDGNNTKVSERNRSAAFGTGATPPILDRESLARMEDWLDDRRAAAVHRRLPRAVRRRPGRARARPVYARECAGCHGASGRDFTGEHVGKVTPIAEIGTDRGRLDNYTHDLAVNQNVLYAEYRRRALPDLPQDPRLRQRAARRALAAGALPAQRLGAGRWRRCCRRRRSGRAAFLRGYDVYDPRALGFVSDPGRIDPAVYGAAVLLRHRAPGRRRTARRGRRR